MSLLPKYYSFLLWHYDDDNDLIGVSWACCVARNPTNAIRMMQEAKRKNAPDAHIVAKYYEMPWLRHLAILTLPFYNFAQQESPQDVEGWL